MAKTVANTTKQEKFPDFTFFSCWYKIRNMQQNKMRIVALRVLLHSLVYKEESTDMRKSILPVGGKFMEHITLFTDILPEERVSALKSGRKFFRMEKPSWNIPAP